MFKISESYLQSPRGFGASRPGRASGAMGKAIATQAVDLISTAGTGYALGYVEGKYGMPHVPYINMSADIFGAGLVHVLMAFGGNHPKAAFLRKNIPGTDVSYKGLALNMANGAATYWAGIQGALMGGAKITDSAGNAVTGNYRPQAMGMGSPRANYSPEAAWRGQFR